MKTGSVSAAVVAIGVWANAVVQVGAQLVAGILIAALWLGWVLVAQERTERAAILLEASRRDGGDRRTRKRRRSG